jgi:hypothetical protein
MVLANGAIAFLTLVFDLALNLGLGLIRVIDNI